MPSISVNNVSLSYTDQGSGPVLLLLHGFPLDRRIWDKIVPDLSASCRVIAVDQRGFGQSQPPMPFTLETLADDAYALMQSLKIAPCVLGGLSMGGYVAQAFAKKYPDVLTGLILLDTKSEDDTSAGKENRNKMIELARTAGAKAVTAEMLPKMLAPETATNRPAVKKELQSIMESCPARTIEYASAAMRDREDFRPLLPKITAPTLLIFGDNDLISPVTIAEQMLSALPHGQLTVITGAGHLSPMEQPQQVLQAIGGFVKQVSTSRT